MKQFLRLGDGYALMSTYDTEKKRLARGPLGISFGTASEMHHVSDSCCPPAGRPVSALSAEKSRNCRGEAAEKLAGLSEANQEVFLLNCVAESNPTFSRGLATYKPPISHVWIRFDMLVIPGKRVGHITDIPAGYAPPITHRSSPKPNTFATFVAVVLALFMCLTAAMQVSAQEAEPADAVIADIKPLQIGDTIPEELWNLPLQVVNHPEGKDTITLNDYRDKKLIILDFWATWCVPCLKSLEKLDALQDAFTNELLILPVGYENREKIAGFLDKRRVLLPSIVSDTELRAYFPHQVIPHHVWIYGGRINSSTSISYANAGNIAEILDGRMVKMITTGDAPPARNAMHTEKSDHVLYKSVFTGVAGGHLPSVSQTGRGLDARNLHLQALIKTAYTDDFDWIDHDSRWVIELPDTLKSRIVLPAKRYGNGYEADSLFRLWLDSNTYCYSLSVPKAMEEKQLRSIMRRDLLEFLSNGFDISVGSETGLRPCYLVEVGEQLRQTAGGEPLYQYTGSYFRMANKPLELLIHAINQAGAFDLPVILGDAVPGENVDVEINGGLKDKMGIQQALDGLGLKIMKAQHRLEVIMLKQINPNTNQS